jgi:cyclopropane-fatty-acyl-phospholipid synthase
MAGSQLGFEQNVVQLHQMLGVKLAADGSAGMPLRPDWEPPRQFPETYPA